MLTGWRYRLASVFGAGAITIIAVWLANLYPVQVAFTTYTPLFWRLDPIVLEGDALVLAVVLNTGIVLAMLVPLYKPQPRRMLDTIFLSQKRVIVGMFALATLGYYNYTYRLPRATLTMTGGILVVLIPLWFIWIRQRPAGETSRVLLIGDDPNHLRALVEDTELPFIGYICPSSVQRAMAAEPAVTNGGLGLTRLGGLSRLDDVLVDYDVDTAILAFRETDRGEFFGSLDKCYEHGINVKVHRRFADAVVTEGGTGEALVDVAIEPWDVQDYTIKRLFDVTFASIALTIALPLIFPIVVAIKLDDGGAIFYRQERTAAFGETFMIYKFRSMIEEAEQDSGPVISDEDAGGVDTRVTRVGRILRPLHLDEIPQLWSILIGDMSVVGPRPERPALESEFDASKVDWQKRWFIKPGLTGLAQINDVTGTDPARKLRYDLEYIRRQSLVFDVKIVLRQMYKVLNDFVVFLSR